jgi:ankyrin repeat protein
VALSVFGGIIKRYRYFMRNFLFSIFLLCISVSLLAFEPADMYWEYNLFEAIGKDDYKYAVELLEKDLDVNKTHQPFMQTPIIIAPNHGMKFVVLLMKHGANVNAKDDDDNTALLNACFLGKVDIVKYLLANGADINVVNKDGISPLEAAKIFKSPETIRVLQEHINKAKR